MTSELEEEEQTPAEEAMYVVTTTPTETESQEEPLVAATPTARRFDRGYNRSQGIYYHGGIADDVCCLWMTLWMALLLAYFVYVHSYLVWTESIPTHAANGLTFSDVPFYAAPPMNPIRSEVYSSLDFWIWMTDYLFALTPFYVIGVFFLVFRHQFTSVGLLLGVYIVAGLGILAQIAKAVYWSVLISAVWCPRIQFCTTHNLGLPPTTHTTQFLFAVIFAWLQVVFMLSLIAIPSVVANGWRREWMRLSQIAGKLGKSTTDVAFSVGAAAPTVRRRTTQQAPPVAPTGKDFFQKHSLDVSK